MNRREFIQSVEMAAMMAALSPASTLSGKNLDGAPTSGDPELKDIYKYIDTHQSDHIKRIQEFLRQPSISSTGEGMTECADLVRRYFVDLKFTEVEVVQTPGHSVIWAHYDAGAKKTLANYGMYDVVPIFTPDKWIAPPFEARMVDMPPLGKAIIARGSGNTKVPLKALLNAIEAIISVRGRLPINMMFVVEGEEELSSRNLGVAIKKHEAQLKTADACLDAKYLQNEKGDVELTLGGKGLVYMELECTNEARGIGPIGGSSSRFATVFGNPAWRLVEALNTMVGKDGMEIKIEGFMDMLSHQPEDLELIDKLLERYDPNLLLNDANARSFYPGLSKRDIMIRYLLTPSLNISGIYGGYTGPDKSTRLPDKATVKIDCRLVPNFEADKIVPLVRAHLDKHGFQDIIVRQLAGFDYFKSPLRDSSVQTLLKTYRDYNHDPLLFPIRPSSGPYGRYLAKPPLNLPFLYGGLGHAGHYHAPNEYVIIEGSGRIASLPEVEKFYVDFIYNFAASPPRANKG
ncbi:MAG: M20/M25/M40 family metallo-hydrolase [Acidobacteria bacterium]|nr:M20/M25/M40 family metallo-hydrolase [Acidobacteriota bacterium]